MKYTGTETQLQKSIANLFILHGWIVLRINSGSTKMQQANGSTFFRAYTIMNNGKSAGVSDLILFKNHRFAFVEVKLPVKKLSKSQKSFKDLAASFGCKVYVIDSIDGADKLAKELVQNGN